MPMRIHLGRSETMELEIFHRGRRKSVMAILSNQTNCIVRKILIRCMYLKYLSEYTMCHQTVRLYGGGPMMTPEFWRPSAGHSSPPFQLQCRQSQLLEHISWRSGSPASGCLCLLWWTDNLTALLQSWHPTFDSSACCGRCSKP